MRLFAPASDWQHPLELADFLSRPLDLLKALEARGIITLTVDDRLGKAFVDPPRVKVGTGSGVAALLAHAASMIGLQELRDRAQIEVITGRSGINPATTPWCAAWAMNLLEMHQVLKLDGLANRNYCPTIKEWARRAGRWQGRGTRGIYTPKPGDAILFSWAADGVPDHVGLVERVADGQVHTIEGNSNDQVRRRAYVLGASVIDGYVRV